MTSIEPAASRLLTATDHVPPPAIPVDEDTRRAVTELIAPGAVVALTGAGMSTASGIPDYRGPDGTRRVQPMQYSEFLADPVNRRRYWARSYAGWNAFSSARPNTAHTALADLQRQGYVHGVITQNVDGLHQKAGSTSVLELHGTLSSVICLDCGRREDRARLQQRIRAQNPGLDGTSVGIRPDGDVDLHPDRVEAFVAPCCLVCSSDRVKPDVVFFGGGVERELVDRAYDWVDRADCLLVLGSSLQVMSGLRFVRHASRQGIPVVAITRGEIRGPEWVDVRLDALIGPELTLLVDNLGR